MDKDCSGKELNYIHKWDFVMIFSRFRFLNIFCDLPVSVPDKNPYIWNWKIEINRDLIDRYIDNDY